MSFSRKLLFVALLPQLPYCAAKRLQFGGCWGVFCFCHLFQSLAPDSATSARKSWPPTSLKILRLHMKHSREWFYNHMLRIKTIQNTYMPLLWFFEAKIWSPSPKKGNGHACSTCRRNKLRIGKWNDGSNEYVSKLRLANIIESYPYSGLLHVDNHQLVPNIVPQLVVPEDFLPDMRWPPQSLPLHWPAPPPKKTNGLKSAKEMWQGHTKTSGLQQNS